MTMQSQEQLCTIKYLSKSLSNNGYLGMRQWQDMFFNKRYASTELVNPDFDYCRRLRDTAKHF